MTKAMMPPLFDVPLSGVNVASVPQRSPFRYAGGKTWFVPHLRRWFGGLPEQPKVFLEAFAGGGILSCTVLAEGLANRVVMVELDEDVVSVWQVIFSNEAEKLARKITQFDLNAEEVQAELSREPRDPLQRAFQTILRNRVNRGGILAPGVGMLKAGENGRGLQSRWYPATLARRILDLHAHRERVTVLHADAFDVLPAHNRVGTAVLLDPPYTAGGKNAGKRLYRYHDIDHAALFELAANHVGPKLLTYDNSPEVRSLAEQHNLPYLAIAMKTTHHTKLTELVIGDW